MNLSFIRRSIAAARLVAIDPHDPDARTSLADARAALCLARGVDLDDIDPATGHDLSRRAYETARASWRDLIAERALSPYMRSRFEAAHAYWAARRPEYCAADDWTTNPPAARHTTYTAAA